MKSALSLPTNPSIQNVGSPRAWAKRGFTLFEIAVVLFIIALMALLVMPSVGRFQMSRLKEEARRLAGRSQFLFDQAATQKLVLRLTFNLDANTYSVTRLDPHSPNPTFVPDLDPGMGPVQLPKNVRMRDVTVQDIGTVSRGTIACNYYPEGYVDATIVHLADPAGRVYTLVFAPLTGKVAINLGDGMPGQVRKPS
ncbi:MAG TPA: type II secretion system protein [Candidatus Binataceae bacterium]|nr:type II secretion system protein [Candidatus Binataceae bacterium]